MSGKPILVLDFDGVLHSYASGWQGADKVADPPVPGAAHFIARAQDHFVVAVHSSRSHQPGGIEAMQAWLRDVIREAGYVDEVFSGIQWPTENPPAMLTIDDRTITFEGWWPEIEDLRAFRPWNKKEQS